MPRAKKMKPFNHPHEFYLIEVREEHLNSICFGCKQALSAGSCYSCPKCSNFFLHKSCSEVPQALQHKAHSQHTLGLLFPPLCNGTPDACDQACNSFTYNCTLCNFNLHVDCASNLENEAQDDREQEALKETRAKIESMSSQLQMLQEDEEKRLAQEMMEKDEINLQCQQIRLYQQQINLAEESMKRMGQV